MSVRKRKDCFYSAKVRIIHKTVVGLRALGRILTFMVGKVRGCWRGVCRGRQKLVHAGTWQEEGGGWSEGVGGGGLSNPGRGERH